jgi:hypothetical protein
LNRRIAHTPCAIPERLRPARLLTALCVAVAAVAVAQQPPAAMTSPRPGSSLGSPNVTFSWTPASGATWYELWLGSTPQVSDDPLLNVSPYNDDWRHYAQGMAIDAAGNTYMSSDGVMAKYDSSGNELWSTGACPGPTCALNFLPAGAYHIGDIDYFNGMLYATVEYLQGCSANAAETMAIYSAATGELISPDQGVGWFDISGDGEGEAGTVTVVPTANDGHGVLVVGSYCNAYNLWVFDLQSPGTWLGTIPLSVPVPNIQGVSWNAGLHQFAITSDGESAPGVAPANGFIWLADWDGKVGDTGVVVGGQPILDIPQTGETEGNDYSQGYIAYLVGGVGVFYYQNGSTTFEPSVPGGSNDLYDSGPMTGSSVSVTLPENGEPVYARLITDFNGAVMYNDYTYGAVAQAVLTAPTPGSILTGSRATFQWTAGSGATAYELWIGDAGEGSNNLCSTGSTTATSITRTDLPTNGEKLYVRLFTDFSGTWTSIDYTLTAAGLAVVTSPTPSSTLLSPTVTFKWAPGIGAKGYKLWLGSMGPGSNDLHSSVESLQTSVTAAHLPVNGETIYARLFSNFNGLWEYYDYTYTAATRSALTEPQPGSTLPGSSVTFTWTPAAGATGYRLWLGTTGVNSNNLHSSAVLTGTSSTVAKLPTNGETVYARLFTDFNGVWSSADYTYTAASDDAQAGSRALDPAVW